VTRGAAIYNDVISGRCGPSYLHLRRVSLLAGREEACCLRLIHCRIWNCL